MRYRLRTLMILLALGPIALAAGWRWHKAREEATMRAAMQRYLKPCQP